MADNFAATPGSGATFGMDEVVDATLGTVKVGFGKIMDGTLDSTNKLIVNSSGEALVKPTANSQVDLNKVAGTVTDVNSGNKSAGTIRVVLATDQPALTNKLLVTPDLPSGAATAAKQPALGTAGTASADVITVQGKASMTPILTDGSATTQPVSGTVTTTPPANASTNVAQIAGTATSTGNGTQDAGTIRVSLASDTTGRITSISSSVTPGTSAGNLGKAEDAASASGDTGVGMLVLQQATPGDNAGTDGDYAFPQMSAGRLWTSSKIDTALPAGAAVIGKVSIDQTTPGTTNLVALTAETTKVIGVTRTSDGAGNLLTSNSTTYTAKFGLDANILGTLGTAFSTAGKVDVKGADGDVFVRQTTAANLNATAVQGTAAALTGGWPTINGEAADTTGTFTNATQSTSITASNLNGYGNVLISINGTYGTATAVFEGSDDGGTTWYGISEADRTDSNIIESGYTSLTNTTRAWQISNPGWDSVRVRSTAVASGTVNVRISPSGAPTAAGASVSIGVALPAGNAVIGHVITDTGSTTAVTGTVAVTESGTWNVGSSTATGSAVPANAFYNGVNAQTALPTAATAGNLTGATADKFGRAVVLPGTIRDLVGTQTTTIAASTSETTIVTAAASVFNDLTALVVSNTSATAVRVDFRDTTAGSVLFSIYVPAGDVRGVAFNRPIPQTSVNTNWTAQSSASVTDLRIYCVWDKNK